MHAFHLTKVSSYPQRQQLSLQEERKEKCLFSWYPVLINIYGSDINQYTGDNVHQHIDWGLYTSTDTHALTFVVELFLLLI